MTSQVTAGNGLQSPTLQVVEFAGAGYYDFDGSDRPAYYRGVGAPDGSSYSTSFRSVLYVKL